MPNALNIYDVMSGSVPPGLYIAFTGTALDVTADYFGRTAGPGPVFAAPGAVSAALDALVASVARNPPLGESLVWKTPDQVRLRDVDGYLSYVALCLDLIGQTNAGHQLLNDLSADPARTTLITPGLAGNQTGGGGDSAVTTLTRELAEYARGGPVPKAAIDAAVRSAYGGNGPAEYDRLATAMNAAPLYTLFDTAANFQHAYLQHNFEYHGGPLTGNDLHGWVSPAGHAAFETALRAMSVPAADGVAPLEFFLLALGVVLLPVAVAGTGNGARVGFFTQNADMNHHDDPEFRPPAIGLAHELVHAWHYTRGRSPGYEIYSYDTTAAELKFTGIGPFAGDPVTENAVRGAWAAVHGLDPSNTWPPPGPVQRPVYSPLQPNEQIAKARLNMRCI
ncbi:M91 family zinc metallopeptidase [Actinomadura sp. WMMA1423]|uniref:M91 family zinc metallopeptidase n=1 Tax=Actinomadura sp. WMMA1423 TaxID=2591108 RepID=UPI00143DE915|nr:M91 family zinc metallopeptidase [Actinomadura sp. WMMA1423]